MKVAKPSEPPRPSRPPEPSESPRRGIFYILDIVFIG